MSLEKFSKKLNSAIKNKNKDESLLSRELKLVRGDFLFNLFSYTKTSIDFLSVKNEILFVNGKIYIKINDIYFEIVNRYFLKKVKEPYESQANITINFLKKFKVEPKIILDVGSCWGEYSLILGRHFINSTIYSIEGSHKNYEILLSNISFKLNDIKNVKTFNCIISDNNTTKYITNLVSTMNSVRDKIPINETTYSKVKSLKLSNFLLENNLNYIDFLKLDIEGHEINLLNDLLDLEIKYGQIEIINKNTFQQNLEFLQLLSNKFTLFDNESFNEINVENLKNFLEQKLLKHSAFDVFINSKNIK